MDNLKKIETETCHKCGVTLKRTIVEWNFPPELIAMAKELGINISKFKR